MTVEDLQAEYFALGEIIPYPVWLENQTVAARNKNVLHEATIEAMREEIQELKGCLERVC